MYGGQSGVKYTPDTIINDSQFTWSYDGRDWQPSNYNNEYFGAVTFRRALENSLNSATGRVAQDVGIRRVREVAQKLGIQSPLPAVPALALGAAEVTPLEVAVAFSTLANGGVRSRPLAVRNVMDTNSQLLEKRDVRNEQVISPQLAYMMNELLKGVLDRGTAAAARRWGFTRPAAGKTGTTNDYKDAWFVGYTPDLLAVVWVGFDGPHAGHRFRAAGAGARRGNSRQQLRARRGRRNRSLSARGRANARAGRRALRSSDHESSFSPAFFGREPVGSGRLRLCAGANLSPAAAAAARKRAARAASSASAAPSAGAAGGNRAQAAAPGRQDSRAGAHVQ